MKKIIFIMAFLCLQLIAFAWIGINKSVFESKNSEVLDISTIDKATHISNTRNSPSTISIRGSKGLFVSDIYSNGYWIYNGLEWEYYSSKKRLQATN